MGQVYYVITDNLRYPKGVVIVTVNPRSLHNDFTKWVRSQVTLGQSPNDSAKAAYPNMG